MMDSVGESSFNSTNSFEDSNNSMNSDEHSDSVHQGLKTFSCKSCDNKSYTTPYALRIHIKNVHEGKRFPCQSCDLIFTQNHSLTRHIKNDNCKGLKQEKSVVYNNDIKIQPKDPYSFRLDFGKKENLEDSVQEKPVETTEKSDNVQNESNEDDSNQDESD